MANMTRAEQIRKVQELCFACVDLNLYLDNNPEDKNAVSVSYTHLIIRVIFNL